MRCTESLATTAHCPGSTVNTSACYRVARKKVAVTERERLIALFALCLVQAAKDDAKPLPIRPTMRPDPQAVTVSHGTLISHANA